MKGREKLVQTNSRVDQPNAIPSSVPPEQRDEVIDSLKSQLAKALSEQEAIRQQNQELEKERDALQNLVKEYENGLETVTNKLRAYAVSFTILLFILSSHESMIRMQRQKARCV